MKKTEYTCDWCSTVIGNYAHEFRIRLGAPPRTELSRIKDSKEQWNVMVTEAKASTVREQRTIEADLCESCYAALERWITGWRNEHL